jgi:hypothetical protein
MSAAVTPLSDVDLARQRKGVPPPRQYDLFHLQFGGVWVYQVEYRLWQKFYDGTERWSEWHHGVSAHALPWYKRECDAQKALERYRARYGQWGNLMKREYRVQPVWYESFPYRRDLDENRKTAARIKRERRKSREEFIMEEA